MLPATKKATLPIWKPFKLSFVAKSRSAKLRFETLLRCFYFSYFILLTGSDPVPATKERSFRFL